MSDTSSSSAAWPDHASVDARLPASTAAMAEEASTAAAVEAGSEPAADDAPPPTFSFMREEAPAAASWRAPAVQGLLAGLALLLVLLLAAQVLVQERDRLAAQFPAWRPALDALCEPLECRVDLLRQIDAVAIDNSSFTKVSPGVYRLGFTLRNTALVALAMPALELALTDAQDEVIVRRVFQPAELQTDSAQLSARAELNDALLLSLQTPEGVGPPAGYRLVAFYP